ncbi:hypothetical protein GUJ93_ZPchr0006g44457 [Zizania palustris]|uniref:Uncharacterized protein n=1 Tax=Zizania palustris TaxID=103762 RepID=A0A8J5SU16_ZIZPA|nr:hypothetical protein GUJ93_ZPchr0006g44457 [Zizania palustris]
MVADEVRDGGDESGIWGLEATLIGSRMVAMAGRVRDGGDDSGIRGIGAALTGLRIAVTTGRVGDGGDSGIRRLTGSGGTDGSMTEVATGGVEDGGGSQWGWGWQ